MSSLIKPSTGGGGTTQNSSVPTPLNKPSSMHHQQGTPQSYGQPSTNNHSMATHTGNPTAAHNHPPSNHYLNPSTFTGNAQNPPVPPSSNHPITSTNPSQQPSNQPQTYSGAKNMTFQGGYQPNLGHPPNVNQNQTVPPVSQTLPATNTQQELSHSNGTNEEKPQDNHVENKTTTPQTPTKTEKSTSENQEKPTPPSSKTTPGNSPNAKQGEPQKVAPAQNSSTSKEEKERESENGDVKEEEKEKQAQQEDEEEVEEDEDEDNEMDIETEINENTEIKENKEMEKTPPPPPQPKPRTNARKQKKNDEDSPKKIESKPSTSQKSPSSRSKRARIRTQHYQSPLPELEIISKISAFSHRRQERNKNDDKLTVFFRNEFLAVRNSEGSFYVCQAVQNIYRSSSKIKIRWLSQDKNDKNGEIYTPDFYDHTEFDCILTNLNLEKIEKGKFRLPPAEKERTDSILKRSLAAEKGEEISSPSVTEEHPDGLDLSLYKDEMQLNKRKGKKRKASSPLKTKKKTTKISTTKSPENSKVAKVTPKTKSTVSASTTSRVDKKTIVPKKSGSQSRIERAKRRNENSPTKVSAVSPKVDQKKAKALAKVARKTVAPTTSKTQQVQTKKTKTDEKSTKLSVPTLKTNKKTVAKVSTKKKSTKKSKK